MAYPLTSLPGAGAIPPFDELIDVRSPAEYGEDHIPSALNLPVLSNDERAEIGTIYVQDSPFVARKRGAALVAANAARHLLGPLADRPKGYRPLVYCWRGGQRSGAFAAILRQIGWQADTIDGGYRAYRRLVHARLYERPLEGAMLLLDGNTGSAKTDLLAHLRRDGHQVLDLEALANHRGSLFGARAGGQPSQKRFESTLAAALARLSADRPVVVEAESAKIGRVNLPPMLWQAMCRAPRLELRAPLAARVDHICASYRDIAADPDRLTGVIDALTPFHPAARIDAWRQAAATGALAELAAGLMADHYDPLYARQRARFQSAPAHQVTLSALGPRDLDAAAARIGDVLAGLSPAGSPGPPAPDDQSARRAGPPGPAPQAAHRR